MASVTPRRQIAGLAGAVLLLVLVGCQGLEYVRSDTHILPRPAANSVEVLRIYEGAFYLSEGQDGEVPQTALAIVQGRPVFTFGSWFTFDLEDLDEDMTPRQRQLVEAVEVRAAGSVLDPEGQVCLYQHVVIHDLELLLAELNDSISREVAGDLEPEGDDVPEFDERTAALWRARIEAGEPWVRCEDGTVEMTIPLSRADKDRWLGDFFRELEEDDDFLVALLQQFRGVEYEDELVRLRIGGGDRPLRLHLDASTEEYRPVLAEWLTEAGYPPDPELTLAAVQGLLESAP